MRLHRHVAALCLAAASLGPAAAESRDTIAGLSRGLAQAASRDGITNPALLPLIDRLAGAQSEDGELGQAVAMRRRALKIAIAAYGPDSTNTAAAMLALARVQIELYRYLDAEPLLIVAGDIVAAAPDGKPGMLADILAGQARIALARGDGVRAETLAEQAVAAGKAGGSTEPLRVLGAVYASEGRFAEGERLLRDAVARDTGAQGETSFEAARSTAQLVGLLVRQRRFAEALPLIERTIAIDQAQLGDTHPLIADDFCDLGLVYEGLGRTTDARDAVTFAINVLQHGVGRGTARVAYAEIELARILGSDDGDAKAAFRDARRLLDSILDSENRRERRI